MHPSKKAQIAHLKVDEAFTKVLSKYTDFADVFSSKLVVKLPKYIKINNYTIKLVDDQQFLYNPIYSLNLMKLKTLKTYIKYNLANSFIRHSKSLVGVFIFFDKKPNITLRLCVNCQSFNNLTIKN